MRVGKNNGWSVEAVHWVEDNTSGDARAGAERTPWCPSLLGLHYGQERSPIDLISVRLIR